MPSVDTRLERYWSFAKAFKMTGETLWLDMLGDCVHSSNLVEAAAAAKFISRHKANPNVVHTG